MASRDARAGAAAGAEPVVISSLVVETAPGCAEAAAEALAALPGVEVHERQAHERASSFIQVEGVTGVNLVYCNFEDEYAARR